MSIEAHVRSEGVRIGHTHETAPIFVFLVIFVVGVLKAEVVANLVHQDRQIRTSIVVHPYLVGLWIRVGPKGRNDWR